MSKLSICLLLSLSVVLSACGGGGSPKDKGDITIDWQAGVYTKSNALKNKCASPRVGRSLITGELFPDKIGSTIDEKSFLRSWSHETYLWYKELTDIDPANSDTPQEYFAKLKTNATTSSGKAKDYFHFYEPTEDSEAWEAGITYGYGIELKVYSNHLPRDYRVAYVIPDSEADNKGVKRGDKIIELDNYSLEMDTTEMGVNALNNALFPENVNEVHTFTLLSAGDSATHEIPLASAQIEVKAIAKTAVINQGNDKIGYIQFNTFIANAQDEWVNTINDFKENGVTDLMLDLRYNGGGLISVASMVSYMIGGSNVSGKTFLQYVENDQYSPGSPEKFQMVGIYGENEDVTLPSLNFNRVYILATGDTCSASELVVNSLRGAGVKVYLVGNTTCGKPYAFVPEDNCGTTYYTIQAKSSNAVGYGDYVDGFTPSVTEDAAQLNLVKGCEETDDLSHALGDPAEAILARALNLQATGSCSMSMATNRMQKTQASQVDGKLIRSPREEISIFDL